VAATTERPRLAEDPATRSRDVLAPASPTPPPGGARGSRRSARLRRIALPFVCAIVAGALMLAFGAAPWLAVVAIAAAPLAVAGVRTLRADPAPMPGARTRIALSSVLAVAFAGVMAWVVANMTLNPSILTTTYGPLQTSSYSPGVVAFLVPLLLLASIAIGARSGVPRLGRRARRLVQAAAVLAAFGVQLVIARSTARIPTSDTYVVLGTALRHVQPDAVALVDPTWGDHYYSLYPNNLPVTALLTVAMSLAALVGATTVPALIGATLMLNCAVLTGSAVMTVLVVRRLLGRSAAMFAVLPVTVFIVLSPWINLPYTDSLAIPFPIALLLIAITISDRRPGRLRVALWLLLGAVGALGCLLKPTVVFAFVAIGAVLMLRELALAGPGRRRLHAAVGPAFAAGGAVLALLGALQGIDALGLVGFRIGENTNAMPFTHFMDMGVVGNGGYSEDDVIRSSALPAEERFGADLQVWFDRVAAMGPWGYLLFLGRKSLFILADGSFWQGWDGWSPIEAFTTNPTASGIQQWYLLTGSAHGDLGSLWQAVWLLLLVLLAIPAVRGSALPKDLRMALHASLLALLAFLLLGEARSRYLYLYVPFFVVLAAANLGAARRLLVDLRSRLPRRGAQRGGTRAERIRRILVGE
jgi:hypothetical protein